MFNKLRELTLAALAFAAAAIFIPVAIVGLAFALIYAIVVGAIPAVAVGVLLDLASVEPTIVKPTAVVVWVLCSIGAFISTASSGNSETHASNQNPRAVDSEVTEMNYEHHQKWRAHHQSNMTSNQSDS